MSRRSGYIQIDTSEFISEIEDDDLLDEIKSRKLLMKSDGTAISYDDDLVREAYDELRVGRVHEAFAILDRLINPKWQSQKECMAAYVKAHS